jgi:hypothetical protein
LTGTPHVLYYSFHKFIEGPLPIKNMSEPFDYSKIAENRAVTELKFAELSETGKTRIRELYILPGIFSFTFANAAQLNTPIFFLLGGGIALMLITGGSGSVIFDLETQILMMVIAFVAALAAVHGLYRLAQALRTPIAARSFVTPMYAVQTDGFDVKYWGIWTFVNFLETEHYVNGIYSHTEVDLLFADGDVIFTVRGARELEQIKGTILQWKILCDAAIEQKHWDYFRQNDILAGVTDRPMTSTFGPTDNKPGADGKRGFSFVQIVSYILIAALIAFVSVKLSIGLTARSDEMEKQRKSTNRK